MRMAGTDVRAWSGPDGGHGVATTDRDVLGRRRCGRRAVGAPGHRSVPSPPSRTPAH